MRSYEFDDYPELFAWFQKRGLRAPTDDELPDEGFIVPGVAAGFLVQTDTSTAILDFFISDPEASKSARDQALNQIAVELIGRAKALGFRRVSCDSQLDTIVRRARALGFTELGAFKVFSKEI